MSEIQIPVVKSPGFTNRDVCFYGTYRTRFGLKVDVTISPEVYDTMMNFEWERTHRRWVDGREAWGIDYDSLGYVTKRLHEEGFSMAVTRSCVETLRNT